MSPLVGKAFSFRGMLWRMLKSQQESRCLLCPGVMPPPYVRLHVSGRDAGKETDFLVRKSLREERGCRAQQVMSSTSPGLAE